MTNEISNRDHFDSGYSGASGLQHLCGNIARCEHNFQGNVGGSSEASDTSICDRSYLWTPILGKINEES